MNVLIVGSDGRAHTLAWKISQSPLVTEIICAPGNFGTSITPKVRNISIGVKEIDRLADFADQEKVDFTVVSPEGPLADGIVDVFTERKLKIIGPTMLAAQLESSKVFAKKFMAENGIPTASFAVFNDPGEAKKFVELHSFPLVIKADGLCAGKGVIICHNLGEAFKTIDEILVDRKFKEAGKRIIIEQFIKGEEASYIVLVDFTGNYISFATSQDHKTRDDGDKGPNTGGMGAYSPALVVTENVEEIIKRDIIRKTIDGMEKEGTPFSGILYAGVMIRHGAPYVLEYNVRLGDPEAQPIMVRLESDIVPVFLAMLDGNLDKVKLSWDKRPALCVVKASKGYPDFYKTGCEITGTKKAEETGAIVFHAGTETKNGKLVNSGGRVLGITALGNDFAEAQANAYKAADLIHCEGNNLFCRRDIGYRAVEEETKRKMMFLEI
jgi:phosphoribosylamine--glycine ligase